MTQNKIVHVTWFLLSIYLLYLLSKLAWFDSLSSFANDSVHYLVMARHYSPWQEESAAIAAAWLLQDFPPFFPWLLAITGAAHSFLYSHLLVTGIGFGCLILYYSLAIRWLEHKYLVIFPVLIFALSPGFLLGMQGILSEPLFLLLTLAFICYYIPERDITLKQLIVASVLLSAILLTRTIGFALCFAILAQALFSSISEKKIHFKPVFIAIISVGVYLLFMEIWGPVKESHYFDILIPYITGEGPSAGTADFTYLSQLKSLLYNWNSFWIVFWIDEFTPIYLVIAMFLLASLSGLAIRLFKNKYDAWYVLFYLLILTAWPHPGQMFRLIFPIMPLLLIYAGYGIIKFSELIISMQKKEWLPIVFYIFVFTAILPSHIFFHARASTAVEKNMVPIYEYFRRADPRLAERELLIYNQMFQDFRDLKHSIRHDEKVMYFLPAYLAILSDRTGITSNSPVEQSQYMEIAKKNNASYIFLTRIHPRRNNINNNGLEGIEYLKGWTVLKWCSRLPDNEIVSCLFEVQKPQSHR